MSVTVDVVNTKGKKTGSVDLPEEVFDAQANISLMHQVVVAQLAAKRQGTAKAKGRGEVSGGGAKPYRQKGTGRARQGSTRAPQFAGGGVVHGPQPRNYAQKTPKKMKAAALKGALSDRARAGLVYVVSSLVAEGVVSTKTAIGALRSVCSVIDTPKKRVLVVLDRDDLAGWVSLRNVPSVHLLVADQLNTYDVLVSDAVVFTQGALEQFLGGAAEFTISDVDDNTTANDDTSADADPAKDTKSKPKARRSARKATPLVSTPEAEDDAADTAEADAAEADTDTTDDDSTEADTDEAPYGEGSHAALPDDSAPNGFDIKGNADSMLYHLPGSSFYDRTVAEVWFDSEEAAEAAGFQLPPSQRDDATDDDESGAAK